MVGGFASSEGFFGCELRWLTYFLWNFTYQIVGMLMPFISTFIFCFYALFNTLGTLSGSMPNKFDPNNWTIADWAYFFGAKSGIEKSKWLYAIFIIILVIFTVAFLLVIYICVVLPGCWFTCACVAIGITLRYYFSFFLVPLSRSADELKYILASDYKLLMFIFGVMCIMDAMKYLDKITYNTMIVFFIGLILHAIVKGLQD